MDKVLILGREMVDDTIKARSTIKPVWREGRAKGKSGRLSLTLILLLVAIVACANELFDLAPWAHVHGRFNVRDLGLLLLMILFMQHVVAKNASLLFDNGFSILIILYLFFVILQAAIVSFNFGQSVISGLIAIRHQFYYLAFFVFLALFDSREKIEQFMKVMFILGVILIILGTINHFGFTIFHHRWAEGHNIRSGIMRAYFPGMDIITLGLIWSVVTWSVGLRGHVGGSLAVLLFTYAHMLRQTRSRLVAITAVIGYLLIKQKNYKALAVATVLAISAVATAEVVMEENIFLAPFTSSIEDVTQGTGSWSGRMEQLETDIQIFLEHPYLGSGTAAIRVTEGTVPSGRLSELAALARKEDLGYGHWIKAYGIPGIFWLIALFIILYRYFSGLKKVYDHKLQPLVLVSTGYISFVILSFITLPHLMRNDLVFLFCLMLAILVRQFRFNREARLALNNPIRE